MERAFKKAAGVASQGKLTVNKAREIIADAVRDVFMFANADAAIPSDSIKTWMERWLKSKKIETKPTTYLRYKGIVEAFTEFLGDDKCQTNIEMLQRSDIESFRNREAKERAIATANLGVKVLRACFGDAEEQELIPSNPAKHVKLLESTEESKRRPFTLSEIKRILKVCDDEWRGLVLFGLYIGQRLGDLAKLTWRAVDLETDVIAFTTRKTSRRIVLPLVQPLLDYLSELPASDNPNAPIFPNAAAHKHTASLSNQFRDILVDAGLADLPSHQSKGKGLAAKREMSELSFHSLRHSAVTLLKAGGVSDFMAREIVGHSSSAVSRQYTHLSPDDLRKAMRKLPDVTEGAH